MVDGPAVDHQAVDDGDGVPLPELAQQVLPRERGGDRVPVLVADHGADVPLGVGEEVFPGGVELQLPVALVGGVALIVARFQVDAVHAGIVDQQGHGHACDDGVHRSPPQEWSALCCPASQISSSSVW